MTCAPQDAVPVAGAGEAWLHGWPVYEPGGVPATFADHLGAVPAEYLVPYVSPPTALPLSALVYALGGPVLVPLGVLALLRAFVLVRAHAHHHDPANAHRHVLALVCALPAMVVCASKGQTAAFLPWAIAAAVIGGPVEAVIALTIGVAYKVTPLAVVVALLFVRPRVAAATLAALTVLSVFGLGYWSAYVEYVAALTTEVVHAGNAAPRLWIGAPAWLLAVGLGAWVGRCAPREDLPLHAWLLVGLVAPLMWGYYAPASVVAVVLLCARVGTWRLSVAVGLVALLCTVADTGAAWAGFFVVVPVLAVSNKC